MDYMYIDTFSGKRIYPFNPDPDLINLEDIAHVLSLQCRFGGHCLEFYSIAQHSVYVSKLCTKELALWGLLHDASEAYIGDLVKPLKRAKGMEKYVEAEELLMKAIAQKFNLSMPIPDEVKLVDKTVLIAEKRDIMRNAVLKDWEFDDLKPANIKIRPISPKSAETLFLKRFKEITDN